MQQLLNLKKLMFFLVKKTLYSLFLIILLSQTSFSLYAQSTCGNILDFISGYAAYKNVVGGDGQSVYTVTNTNDNGSGSYRDALSQGNRYIIFAPTLANQTIDLNTEVAVYGNKITVDGRNAPNLKISRNATKFEGTNYVVAYMNYHNMDADTITDGITFRNAPAGGQTFFVYKCTFNVVADGAIDVIWNQGNDVHGTISHCKFQNIDKTILHHAGTTENEGGHYYLSFNHNWFYKTGQRNPFGREGTIHYYNNLLEDWGGINNDGQGAYAGTNARYLVENNIAIAASAGDLNWAGVPIATPKTKAFAPSWGNSTAAIKSTGIWLQNEAYTVDQLTHLVSTPPYDYSLSTANAALENYIRQNANSKYSSSCCTYTTINFNNFDATWGIWNDGGSDCRRSSYDATYAYSGNRCVRLRDNTGTSVMTTNNLNLSGYNKLKVDFTYITKSMDNSLEDFWLQISTDGGSTFNNVDEWNLGDEFTNLVREFDAITISGPFTANTKLRFRCDASANGDQVYIDDVRIQACLNAQAKTADPLTTSIKNDPPKIIDKPLLVSDIAPIPSLRLYPNPVNQYLTIQVDNCLINHPAQLVISNIKGKAVHQQRVQFNETTATLSLNVTPLQSGIYISHLQTAHGSTYKKFIVSR